MRNVYFIWLTAVVLGLSVPAVAYSMDMRKTKSQNQDMNSPDQANQMGSGTSSASESDAGNGISNAPDIQGTSAPDAVSSEQPVGASIPDQTNTGGQASDNMGTGVTSSSQSDAGPGVSSGTDPAGATPSEGAAQGTGSSTGL